MKIEEDFMQAVGYVALQNADLLEKLDEAAEKRFK